MTHNKIGQTTTHTTPEKNKTIPFIYNKSQPINDNTKNLSLENTNKNYYFFRNTNKNHFLDKTYVRKNQYKKQK